MQLGDVKNTFADIDESKKELKFTILQQIKRRIRKIY